MAKTTLGIPFSCCWSSSSSSLSSNAEMPHSLCSHVPWFFLLPLLTTANPFGSFPGSAAAVVGVARPCLATPPLLLLGGSLFVAGGETGLAGVFQFQGKLKSTFSALIMRGGASAFSCSFFSCSSGCTLVNSISCCGCRSRSRRSRRRLSRGCLGCLSRDGSSSCCCCCCCCCRW